MGSERQKEIQMKYLSALTVLSCLALCHAKPLNGDAPTENGKGETQKDPCSNKFYIGCLGIHHDAPNNGKNEDGIRKFVEAWKMSPKDLSDIPYSPPIYNRGIHHDAPNNGKNEDGIRKLVEAWKMSPKDLFYIPYNGDAPNNRKMMTG